MIFVARALWDPFKEGLPNAGVSAKAQSMSAFAPAIEVAHHRHLFGVGGPHCEMCPLRAIQRPGMRSQSLMQMKMRALIEEIDVLVAQQWHTPVSLDHQR